MIRHLRLMTLSLLLGACTSPSPLPPAPATGAGPTPGQILAGGRRPVPHALLTWGGTVQAIHNRRDTTLLEVMSYPLDPAHRPMLEQRPSGAFVVEMKGFIEPAELPIGRPVTVTGRYVGIARVPFGTSRTDPLPLLEGEALKLWEKPVRSGRTPEVRFGIGVGTGGSGVSIGIGL